MCADFIPCEATLIEDLCYEEILEPQNSLIFEFSWYENIYIHKITFTGSAFSILFDHQTKKMS